MFRNMIVTGVILVLAVSFNACKKEEVKSQLPPGHPSMEGDNPSAGMPELPKVDRSVVVPREILKKWNTVKLKVEDKTTRSAKEYDVPVGASLDVPHTKIRVKVLSFLPDFRMGDRDITTASDKPNNPAAQIVVHEPGKEDWKGWLYTLYPQIHPFQHERIALILVGGVSKRL